MTVDPAVVPGLLLLGVELLALAALGYVVARVALRQSDDLMALASGLVIGPSVWGLASNFVLHLLPGRPGAMASWLAVLAVAGGLAWQGHRSLRIPARTLAGFGAVVLTLGAIGLAGWQMLTGPPDAVHLGLAAQIEAGGWPPTLPWSPWQSVPYHYGIDLLIGLLAPPFGPDLPLTTEVLGAYVWAGFILIVAMFLRRNCGWAGALVLTPVVLTAGAWTLVLWIQPPSVLEIPVPAGLPQAGLRTALAATYWPAAETTDGWPYDRVLANVWTPWFVVSYALAFVVLERVADGLARRSVDISQGVFLGALVGFLGLADETVAASVLAIWGALVAAQMLRDHLRGRVVQREALRVATGPAVAAVLLAVGGGVVTGVLARTVGGGLSLGWLDDPGGRGLIGSFVQPGGGLGVLGLGPLVVAGAAVLLGWRDRLALALALASGVFLLAVMTVQYELAAHDVVRLDGHARNFALLAVLAGTSVGLRALRPRWRTAAAVGVLALVTWPTIAGPVRGTGLALGQGVHLANAAAGSAREGKAFGRTRDGAIRRPLRPGIRAYIRERAAVDARILSPSPQVVSVATGRPNASGFVDLLHLLNLEGPEYLDAVRYLEPAALRQLGIVYVHAPDEWTAELPARAGRWLSNPDYFELLARDGPDALYRVRLAFLALDVQPTAESFEALRRAIPADATVYLAPGNTETVGEIRVASALSHTRVLGAVWTGELHPLLPPRTEPLGGEPPDVVVAAWNLVPSAFDPDKRQPIWWNDAVVVYAPRGGVAPIMAPWGRAPNFGVRISEVAAAGGRMAFAATFSDRAPDQWTGQDWLVTAGDGSPWALPRAANTARRQREASAQWYAGQLSPGLGTKVHRYVFDPSAATLAARSGDGASVEAASSGRPLTAGEWTLAVRLRRDWHEVAFVPVMQISVSESGQVSYQGYEGELGARLSR